MPRKYKTPLGVTCKRNYDPKKLEAAVRVVKTGKYCRSKFRRGSELPDSDSNQEESSNCWLGSFEERLKHDKYDTASSGSQRRRRRRRINVSHGKSILGRDMAERETEGQKEEAKISVLEQEQEEVGLEEQPQEGVLIIEVFAVANYEYEERRKLKTRKCAEDEKVCWCCDRSKREGCRSEIPAVVLQ
ncbi:hypothetical protein ANN_27041 [Periplaneta americana]|uniref:Uncharacterized protein n=1 Tax=Periplaneta americana TaxID=6978 RepID=A0ABQ8RX74_PERAM|nr:hypothetical protein ANN_27041 [Periplaneta americana]